MLWIDIPVPIKNVATALIFALPNWALLTVLVRLKWYRHGSLTMRKLRKIL